MQPSSSPIRALIFDYGGVLMRTQSQEPRRQLARRLGFTVEELYHAVFDNEAIELVELGQLTAFQCGQEVLARFGLRSEEEIRDFWSQFFGGDALDTVLVGHIRHWRRSYKTALLSNFGDSLHDYVHNTLGIADCFDEIIVSARVGLRKPDPRIYELALNRLQVRAHEAVFIDDMAVNVEGAMSLGMRGIHFTTRQALLAELETVLGDSAWGMEVRQ
jgi:epoxide hydrolase-like predicted phosphatase